MEKYRFSIKVPVLLLHLIEGNIIKDSWRAKYKLEKKYDAKIVILNVTDIDISSSMIRERILMGKE